MQPCIGIITNPNSKKNWNHNQQRARLEQLVGDLGIVRQTRDVDELPQVVDEFFERGCRYWLCDGGDGTLHWVLNAVDQSLKKRKQASPTDNTPDFPLLIPTNGGTVDFVARKAKLKGSAESIVSRLVKNVKEGTELKTIQVDTCRLSGQIKEPTSQTDQASTKTSKQRVETTPAKPAPALSQDKPSSFDRIGFASAIGGVAQNFFEKFYGMSKRRGTKEIVQVIGTAAGSALARSLPSPLHHWVSPELHRFAADMFRPTKARIFVDGQSIAGDSFISVQIGAIDINLAGVVRCFRHARKDGVLHFQALSSNPMGVVCNMPNILLGTPLYGNQVFDDSVRHVEIVADKDESINPVIDGEQFYGLKTLQLSLGPTLKIPLLHD